MQSLRIPVIGGGSGGLTSAIALRREGFYEAATYLLERGGAPLKDTAQRVADTGDTSLIWAGHKARGAPAGLTRAVAILEEG